MRKRITTSIEENSIKELDIKIIQSDFFKDRSGYLEFLIRLSPFIPNNTKPDADIKDIIKIMYVNSGAENNIAGQQGSDDNTQGLDESYSAMMKMAKNFKLKTSTKGEKS